VKNSVTHTAEVIQSGEGCVEVLLKPQSACGSCHARKICGMEEGEERILSVVTIDADRYQAGEIVNVSISQGMGIKAVMIAYAYPFLLVFILLLVLLQIGVNELIAGLSGLAVLAIYYWVLYCLRDRIEKEIQFAISKIAPKETNE